MVFSYNWLQSFFRKKLPKPEKLAELLTMKAFEVEEIKKINRDWVLDIDVLPNRAGDCFSHLGVAREISAILDLKLQTSFPDLKAKEDKNLKAKDFISIDVKSQKDCPRYTARVISDVKVGSSPEWIKTRLKVCGLRPINNVVDIANYVMLETGQPLHAFDGKKLEGGKIIVRFAKNREKIITLDEEKPSTRAKLGAGPVPHRNEVSGAGYDLDENVLVIADAKKPVAVAGIKGGKIPEIDKKTKIVVLESANFRPRTIRKSSKKLGLKTDASLRFEHGIDPNLTKVAINRAADLIQRISGGKILQGLIDFYPKKVFSKRIKLDLDYVERLLGVKISRKEILGILKRLKFKITETPALLKTKGIIMVEVPTARLDISIPEDLIEEIGRIYGYQKIPSLFPTAVLIPPKRNLDIFWEDTAKSVLKGAGFTEVYNYSFIGEKETKLFNYKKSKIITVENPVSLEQKYLRPSLIPNLLKNIKENFKYSDEIKIFELGEIFALQKSKITQKYMLSGAISGDSFYQAKGAVDLLLNKLGISNIWYNSYRPTPEQSEISIWQPKKCAEIKVNRREIGFLGEISSKILDELKLNHFKIVVFDIDFEKLKALTSEKQEFKPISPFPAAIRDLAILVPREILVQEVLNKIEVAGRDLIRDVDLFDIYEGENLPEGKKNLAFHIVYQSETRTLSSKEIEKTHQKIINVLEKNPDWEVRK